MSDGFSDGYEVMVMRLKCCVLRADGGRSGRTCTRYTTPQTSHELQTYVRLCALLHYYTIINCNYMIMAVNYESRT